MSILYAYLGLTASAFTSATILPGTSEAAFAAFLHAYPAHGWVGWLCAGLANGLGSMVSYGMGRLLPNRKKPSEKVLQHLHRWGVWSLLLAWMPIVGDALPIAAGWLRFNPWLSALMLISGKMLRYAVIWAAWAGWVA